MDDNKELDESAGARLQRKLLPGPRWQGRRGAGGAQGLGRTVSGATPRLNHHRAGIGLIIGTELAPGVPGVVSKFHPKHFIISRVIKVFSCFLCNFLYNPY